MSIRNDLLEQILAASSPGGGFDPATDISIERILDATSTTASQEPSGIGPTNGIQINFGPAVNSGVDPVMVDATGIVTINEAGLYRFKVALQFGRTGASGTSVLLFRVLVNDVQAGRSIVAKLGSAEEEQYFENDTWIYLPATTTLKFQLMRDADGSNFGGLFGFDPTVDGGNEWDVAPSAAFRAERLIQTP